MNKSKINKNIGSGTGQHKGHHETVNHHTHSGDTQTEHVIQTVGESDKKEHDNEKRRKGMKNKIGAVLTGLFVAIALIPAVNAADVKKAEINKLGDKINIDKNIKDKIADKVAVDKIIDKAASGKIIEKFISDKDSNKFAVDKSVNKIKNDKNDKTGKVRKNDKIDFEIKTAKTSKKEYVVANNKEKIC
ncbi:MAG: hypothetical protein M3384_17685 [Acidobacteriota bacterium]|nr:hypothetical protein [Acidobacteriota bacterium]